MSKLYDDASVMMIPSSVKDGKLYNVLPQPKPLSGELVTNGTFEDGSSWSTGTGWTISSGKASFDGSTAFQQLQQIDVTQQNKNYKLTFNLSNVGSSVYRVRLISGGSYNKEISVNGDGTYVAYFVSNTGSSDTFGIQNDNNTGSSYAFDIDNISVVEVDQLPADFTFSRGSNLAATRINEQGLIEKGRENLLTQSNTFSSSDWNNERLVSPIQTGFTGYDGSNNAWKIIPDSDPSTHRISQLDSQTGVKTFSVYLKQAGYSKVRIIGFQPNSNVWEFDLATGTNILNPNYAIDYKATDVGNGWWRLELTTSEPHISYYVSVLDNAGNVNFIGNETDGLLIQDAQLEVGLVATDYIESGATTGKAGVLEDLPRLNWGGSCPSLLLEPQRQNLVAYSEYLEEADGLGDAQILNTTDTTPEGTSNAKVLAYNGGTNQHYLSNVPSVTSGQTYTFSVFLKKKEVRYAALIFLNDFCGRFFDLETGSILGTIGSGSLVDSKIEDYGNGWYRCSITDTATSTTKFSGVYLCHSATSFGGFTPTNTDGFYVWGAQIEQGSYATSYIPTHGTSVTRSADETELVSLPNELSGDFSFYLNTEDFSTFNAYLRLNDSNGNYVYAIYSYNNHYDVYNGSSFLVQPDADPNGKLILKREEGTIKIFINGEDKTLSGAVSNNDTITGIEVQQQTNAKISIKELAVFNTALSDNECINLTSI